MQHWLKLIGTTERPCTGYGRPFVEFPDHGPFPSIGDHMLLYAVGNQKRVFALTLVVSSVIPHDRGGDWPLECAVQYLAHLDPSEGVPLEGFDLAEIILDAIRARNSCILIEPKRYRIARRLLCEAMQRSE